VIANVWGPALDQLPEAVLVSHEKRPDRFLEPGFIPRHGNHEAVSRLL
jgi:hypothetical protein